MNLYIRNAGLFLGLVLLLSVSAFSCGGGGGHTAGEAGRLVIDFFDHQKAEVPESVLHNIGDETGISGDLGGLVKKVPASATAQSVKQETEGLDPEETNKVIVNACKAIHILPGSAPLDLSPQSPTGSIEQTLKNSSDNVAVSTICHVAELLEAANV